MPFAAHVAAAERDGQTTETPSMSKIAISLCGEGRGHATRIATLLERL